MTIDVIIIAEAGANSFSATNPLKLTIHGQIADIQVVADAMTRVPPPPGTHDR